MIKKGDKVAVDYEGRFEDGIVFDKSTHGDHSHPLIFVVGEHQVIAGFEDSVVGMKEGEEKEFSVSPAEGYGMRDERLVRDVPMSEFKLPGDRKPEVGMTLAINAPNGQQIPIHVVAVGKDSVTLDMNHPMAGKTMIFKIKVVGVNGTIKEHEHHHG